MPTVGHQPHMTHAEVLARLIGHWLLPCAPGGCQAEDEHPTSRSVPRHRTRRTGSMLRR